MLFKSSEAGREFDAVPGQSESGLQAQLGPGVRCARECLISVSWLCFCVLASLSGRGSPHVMGKTDIWQPRAAFLESVMLKKCESPLSFQYFPIKSPGRF